LPKAKKTASFVNRFLLSHQKNKHPKIRRKIGDSKESPNVAWKRKQNAKLLFNGEGR